MRPKRLPAWLFYDCAGSRLFDEITRLPEYYLTRTERSILAANAAEIVARAAAVGRLRIAELGAGSADKTRLLLRAAVDYQGAVLYEPVDVSASALDGAKRRIDREILGVVVAPRVMDYTDGDGHALHLSKTSRDERRLVLYIGSSIGNFEPGQALRLMQRVRAGLDVGDCFLLGVDLVKDEAALLAAYDDAAGVTAAFNRNVLTRLNRELDADFDPEAFAHRAVWNASATRMEMHLVSGTGQQVCIGALDLEVDFSPSETIHTENSYKYTLGMVNGMLEPAGFALACTWFDPRKWFALHLARVT